MKFQAECISVLNKIKAGVPNNNSPNLLERDIDWENISRLAKISAVEDSDFWYNLDFKAFTFGEYNIRKKSTKELYESLSSNLSLESSIEEYLSYEEANDPHQISFLLSLYDLQLKLNINPEISQTTVGSKKGGLLIILSTGNGQLLKQMLDVLQPTRLCLIVSSEEDFLSSSDTINWLEIWNEFCSDPLKHIHACYPPLAADVVMRGLGTENVLFLDHAYICITKEASKKSHEFYSNLTKTAELVRNYIDYLGFSLDEFHMLYMSALTLRREPKIYSAPARPLGAKYVVCGSGPSLDKTLETIKILSKTHHIIACASNYRTLRANRIRVDSFCMLERGLKEYENYSQVIDEYGRDCAVLVASSTCHEGLFDLFDKSCVYYRPALTPMSLFCNSFSQVLQHEGPQTVNTGLSFALSLGADQIVLCGIDLGSSSLDNIRSSQAAGFTDRKFDIKYKGNLQEEVYTNRLMLDSAMNIEIAISYYQDNLNTNIYNMSDGLFLKGTIPISDHDYLKIEQKTQSNDKINVISEWYAQLYTYQRSSMISRINSKNPYQDIVELKQKMQTLLLSDLSPDEFAAQTFDTLKLLNKENTTLAVRLSRAFILKSCYAIIRQLYVLGEDHESYNKYWKESRILLNKYCELLFDQCIDLIELILCRI